MAFSQCDTLSEIAHILPENGTVKKSNSLSSFSCNIQGEILGARRRLPFCISAPQKYEKHAFSNDFRRFLSAIRSFLSAFCPCYSSDSEPGSHLGLALDPALWIVPAIHDFTASPAMDRSINNCPIVAFRSERVNLCRVGPAKRRPTIVTDAEWWAGARDARWSHPTAGAKHAAIHLLMPHW